MNISIATVVIIAEKNEDVKEMKGIVLAGGLGTRLYPLTLSVSKQLLPVYDKPMIYYPVSVLMELNIRDILIIATERDLPNYQEILRDGRQWGINFEYKIQSSPRGIADAFLLGEEFIGEDSVTLILGDNIFVNALRAINWQQIMYRAEQLGSATVFGYKVENPREFGVIEFDAQYNPVSLQEKPETPKSNYCVVGLYVYPNKVVSYAKGLRPSARGELEITDLNRIYLENQKLCVELLGEDAFWTDAGTCDGLLTAANYVREYENETDCQVSCLEEIAYKNRWIGKAEMVSAFEKMKSTGYGRYLKKLIDHS